MAIRICIIFYFIVVISHAQSSMTFHLIDSLTGSPVPYGIVIDKTHNKGVVSDENGLFRILLSDSDHLFLATTIGYDTTHFIPSNNHSTTIFLSKSPIIQETVTIYNSHPTCIDFWGSTRKRPLILGGFAFRAGSEVAVFMSNDSKKTGTIQKIRFYIGKQGYPTTKFRAKLYGVDTLDGSPANLLIQQDIILNAKEGNEWVEFDITGMNVQIPLNGFFVAMEWLPGSESYQFVPQAPNSADGQFLGSGKATPYCTTWVKGIDTAWEKLSSYGNSNTYQNAMIAADVLIFCDDTNSKH